MPDGIQGQAPPAAPVRSQPPQQAGLVAKARLGALLARKLLEAAVPVLGSESEDGKAVLSALTALKRISGDTAPGLLQSETRALAGAATPVPAAGPAGPPPGGMPMRGPAPAPGSLGPAPMPMPMPAGAGG